jgi:hypothetical protein
MEVIAVSVLFSLVMEVQKGLLLEVVTVKEAEALAMLMATELCQEQLMHRV